MIENNISRSFVSGLRGAEQAQRLTNIAGWARQGVEGVAARSATYVAPSTLEDGAVENNSLHARSVNAVAWARNCKVSTWVSTALDGVVGSGVHAPQRHSVFSREAWRTDDTTFESHDTCVRSLSARFDHMLANPTSVGILGLAVGIAQVLPATVGGAAGTLVGATLGGAMDLMVQGGAVLRRREATSNYIGQGASWGAYLGTGAATLAAATILPFTVSIPGALAVGVSVFAPNLALQALRAANTGLRAAALGTTYVGSAACLLGADAARGLGRQLSRMPMPAFLKHPAANVDAQPAVDTDVEANTDAAPDADPVVDTDTVVGTDAASETDDQLEHLSNLTPAGV